MVFVYWLINTALYSLSSVSEIKVTSNASAQKNPSILTFYDQLEVPKQYLQPNKDLKILD